MKNYRYLTSGLILVWFIAALTASATHVFSNTANRLGSAIGIAALVPLIVFVTWFFVSTSFRQFALTLDPVLLTTLQAWRLIGFIFVLLEAHRLLPALFAFPAGYGDMFIGATATLVAWKFANPQHRGLFIVWQLLGIADLVTAVSVGTTAPLIDPQSISMAPMTALPLSLIPTFFVPLFFIFHIICIAQARQWQPQPTRNNQSLGSIRPASI